MADRTWNAVDDRLYDEDWSMLAILVFARLLAKCPNCFGVFHLPLRPIKLFFTQQGRFSDAEVDAAIAELTGVDAIRLYREGRIVWIVKKYKRDKFLTVASNRAATAKDLQQTYPDVWMDFALSYDFPLDTPMPPLCPPYAGTTDPDPDPDPEISKKVSKKKPLLPAARQGVDLEVLEAKLKPENQEAWEILKQSMDDSRFHKRCKDTVKAAFLKEILQSAKVHGFTTEQVNAGMMACVKADAENEVYFRKAASGTARKAEPTVQAVPRRLFTVEQAELDQGYRMEWVAQIKRDYTAAGKTPPHSMGLATASKLREIEEVLHAG